MTVTVRVPATSANMGAGFDTLGVALNLYNFLEISEMPSGIEITGIGDCVPKNENNLVYRSVKTVFDKVGYAMGGIRISQKSNIPVTRGLGSSSACIIGGMLAANVISGRRLSYPEILDLAVSMEGHPDNLAPALYGGFCISMMDKDRAICKSIKLDSKIKFAVMVPDFFVATKKSRRVLPEMVPHKDAAFNISRAAMFAMLLSSGNMEHLRIAAEDKLHQPYRGVYVENMREIFKKTYEFGARATYLSGSGPTIVSVLDDGYMQFQNGMRGFFAQIGKSWNCGLLSVDNVGAVVKTSL
ncbi:MAG: homoserine kinase [Clostridia bacterium]|nr:homoserine kinase [Clostridia bacterium]